MRHIIIGDIHGCIDELKMLIQKLELKQDDHLYFIGDLIDRGPDSAGVVNYVRSLSEKYPVVLISLLATMLQWRKMKMVWIILSFISTCSIAHS